METKYILKNKKIKILLVVLVLLAAVASAIAIKFYMNKKEDKGIETIDEAWGLGKVVTESVSNNRDYNWYVDKYDKEGYVKYSTGLAVCEMTLKWLDRDSKLTAEEIAKQLYAENITMYDICKKYIVNFDEVCEIETIEKPEELKSNEKISSEIKARIKQKIKGGDICIVPCNMISITFNTDRNQRCGKFVSGSGYNWVILKGYKVVDDKLYFEVYDTQSGGSRYGDGTPVGKDRYYLASEVVNAILANPIYVKDN